MDEPRALFAPPVFRLTRMQVFNWGTFSGLHTVPVAERGHLFIGPSGSGKSTLLDVFSTLLVPPAQRQFNVAAREGERGGGRDRSLASYVRGAWAETEDADVGRPVQQFLRRGATWSAIALTYRGADGATVVLVGVYWMKASTAEVGQLHLIFDAAFDLRELEAVGPDVRKLKRAFPRAFASTPFSDYEAELRRRMHMPSPMALKLLQKAQSAKNLGDLNLFLRDFMLDPPQTFAAAKELVDSFQELDATHQAVVNVRRQIHHLAPARDALSRHAELQADKERLQREQAGLDRYFADLACELLATRIESLTRAEAEAKTVADAADRAVFEQRELIQRRQQAYDAAGGTALQMIEQELTLLKPQRELRESQFKIVRDVCKTLDRPPPESAEALARMQAEDRAVLDQPDEEDRADEAEGREWMRKEDGLKKEAEDLDREIAAMERQPSLIPAAFLEMRADIARALACPPEDLPFAGELMEVDSEYTPWRGAAERVLRTFSLSILVEDRRYQAFNRHVNATHLGRKLEYHWTREMEPRGRGGPKALFNKLRFKPHPLSDWLKAKVAHNFHYICVDDLEEFRAEPFALTREGLSRSGKSRHVKDDTHNINDRRQWVMGFDNREKLESCRNDRRRLAPLLQECDARLSALRDRKTQRLKRINARNTLLAQTWEAIDVAGLLAKIMDAERRRADIQEGDSGLARLAGELKEAKNLLENTLEPEQREKMAAHTLAAKEAENTRERHRRAIENRDRLLPLEEEVAASLSERRARFSAEPTPDTLPDLRLKTGQSLIFEISRIAGEQTRVETGIENTLQKYKEDWAVVAADFQPTMAGAADFMEHLERLEKEELVKHEGNFLRLLRQQGMQRLVALSDQLDRERKAIHERLEVVNEGLKDKEYNPGTHLRIRSKDLHDDTVKQFKDDMAGAFAYALGGPDEVEPAVMEERFLALSGLVNRLKSQEPADARWRDLVLDVRKHVEFIGLETVEATGKVFTHSGSQGKSGGQRQKLTATCLAAALRYQLGGVDGYAPAYTTVALDEAFDKADHHFTRQVMAIFERFGFQMIVSTPMKSVRTLEPFVGGACVVNIREDRVSAVYAVEYEEEHRRLKLDTPVEVAVSVEPAVHESGAGEIVEPVP